MFLYWMWIQQTNVSCHSKAWKLSTRRSFSIYFYQKLWVSAPRHCAANEPKHTIAVSLVMVPRWWQWLAAWVDDDWVPGIGCCCCRRFLLVARTLCMQSRGVRRVHQALSVQCCTQKHVNVHVIKNGILIVTLTKHTFVPTISRTKPPPLRRIHFKHLC